MSAAEWRLDRGRFSGHDFLGLAGELSSVPDIRRLQSSERNRGIDEDRASEGHLDCHRYGVRDRARRGGNQDHIGTRSR